MKEQVNKLLALENIIERCRNVLEIKMQYLLKQKYYKLDIVYGLYLYLKARKYPLSVYDTFGIDHGERDSFKHLKIKVCYDYDYTDIVGLTKRQFKKLQKLIEDEEVLY